MSLRSAEGDGSRRPGHSAASGPVAKDDGRVPNPDTGKPPAGATVPTPAAASDPVNVPAAHPADPLLASAAVLLENWGQPDAVGNRQRVAIIRADDFKYPLLRVVETWSG